MSRAISANLKNHIASEVATLATCWRIERLDGQEFFFTNHDVDLVIDGDTYLAGTGVLPSALSQSRGLAVDNLQAMTFLDSIVIQEEEIMAGKYDRASLDVFVVNWADLTMGKMYLLKDWVLGEVEVHDSIFNVECRGKAQHYQQQIVELYSPDCRADLGDARCTVDLDDSAQTFWRSGTVATVAGRRIFTVSALNLVTDPFRFGKFTWDTGLNAGLSMEVKSFNFDSDEFTLFEAMPYDIQVGDQWHATFGCDKSASMCRIRFDNLVNFRGEPFIPGFDRMLEVGTH